MKPLFVNGRFLSQPVSGMQRYGRCLLAALDRQRADAGFQRKVVLLVPQNAANDLRFASIEVRQTGKLLGHAWEQLELPQASHSGTLLSLTGIGPLLHRDHVLVLHDAAIFANPHQFTWAYRALHRTLRPQLARRAGRLITVSPFSRHELAHHLAVPPERFVVVPNGSDHLLEVRPDPSIFAQSVLERGRYVLIVGNRSANKQIAVAEAAFERAGLAGYQLVHVGGAIPHVLASAGPGRRGTLELGRVDDEVLAALYLHAHALIFPSRYEGFGIPPLEAMSLGCPVVASRAGAVPEVLGSAALYADPGDIEGFARGLRELEEPKLRERMVCSGRARAREFSWRASADQLAAIVDPVCERADAA